MESGQKIKVSMDTTSSTMLWLIWLTFLLCWGDPDLFDAIKVFLTFEG